MLSCFQSTNLQRDETFGIIIILIIKLYLDTIKSGTYVPFTGVYIHVNR